MKTIEVSDKMYESLINLSKEMISQDNRSTAMPHMFQIRSKRQVAAYDGQGEEVWVDEDGDELTTDLEIKNYITTHIYENDESTNELIDEEALKFATDKVAEMDSSDYEEYLENVCNDNWRKVNVTTAYEYKNTFFTAKACESHITQNHYHYNEPTSYLNHAWRNPEMELVSNFLCGLTQPNNIT